ncbi:hypothetical protein [Thermofilum sp.]|uniref:hypothetical protein n=3 Tax=Thermofilum sp. TaxID=1961369 RepID=UPI0031670293
MLYGSYNAVPMVLLAFIILPALPFSLILKKIDKTLNALEAFHIAITFMLFFSIFTTLIFDKKASIILTLFSLVIGILPLFSRMVKEADFDKNLELKMKKEITLLLEYIILSSILLPILTYLLKNTPRWYSADETFYAFTVSIYEQYKVMFAYGDLNSIISSIAKYINGRTIWFYYLYSMRVLSGAKPSELYLSSILFLILVLFASLSILIDLLNVNVRELAVISALFVVFLPIVLPWSITILPDLPQTYFILTSLYFILKSLDINAVFSINLTRFFYFLIFAFYSISFKENMISFAFFLIFLTIFLNRHKKQLNNDARFLLKIFKLILLISLLYIAIVDFGSFIFLFFLNNIKMYVFLRRYFILGDSLAELLFGMFMKLPWDSYTLFSFSWRQWLDFLNFALAPEALSPLLSAIFIALPALSLLHKEFRADPKFKLLALTTSCTYWFYFFTLIGVNRLYDFTRYSLHIYILAALLSITVVYRLIRNHNDVRKWLLVLSILMVIILLINYKVSTELGGTRFFFDMLRYDRSSMLLLVESALIGCALAVARRSPSISFVALMLILFTFSLLFLKPVFDKSWLFRPFGDALKKVSNYLEGTYKGGKVLVISNAYTYLRNYLDFGKFIVIPPPIGEDEFLGMLKVLPNGSYLVLTNHPEMSWYEYANAQSYIQKYVKSQKINLCFNASKECIEVEKVYEVKRDGYVIAVFLKKGQPQPQSLPVDHGLRLQPVNVAYTQKSCILNLKEGSINNTKIILATTRFSKIIEVVSPSTIVIPMFYNSDSLKNIRMDIYVCVYHIAITLDNIDVMWLHMYLKFTYMESILYVGTLILLSIAPFLSILIKPLRNICNFSKARALSKLAHFV